MKKHPNGSRWLAGILAVVLLLSLLPTVALPAAAAEANGKLSVNDDALSSLGLNTTKPTVNETVNPYGEGVLNLSPKSELVTVSGSGNAKSYALYDGKEWEGKGNNLFSSSNRKANYVTNVTGGTQLYTQTAAFDLTGSGKKDHIAQLSMDILATNVTLGVYKADTGALVGALNAIALDGGSAFSQDIPAESASAFLSVAAGDFNGDGYDDVAFTRPQAGDNQYAGTELYVCYSDGSKLGNHVRLQPSLPTRTDDDIKEPLTKLQQAYTLSLAAGDLNGDDIDDLAVAGNAQWAAKRASGKFEISTLSVYQGGSKNWKADKQPDYSPAAPTWTEGGTTKYLRDTTLAVGDIDGDGDNELLVGGHIATLHDNKLLTLADTETEFLGTQAVSQLKLKLTYYSYSQTPYSTYQPSGSWWNGATSSVTGYYASIMPLKMASVMQVEPIACIDAGKGAGASIFLVGKLLTWSGGFSEAFDFAKFTSQTGGSGQADFLSAMFDGDSQALGNTDKKALINRLQAIGVNNNFNDTWVNTAVAGNFLNNQDGSEDIAFVLSSKTSGNKVQHTTLVLQGSGATWKFRAYTSADASSSGSLAAADIDNDGVFIDYQGRADYYFSNPELLAVLQAAPRFKDLDVLDGNYTTAGSTAISKSSGSGTEEQNSFSVTAGVVFGLEYEANIAGIVPVVGAEFETTLSGSVVEDFSEATEVTSTVTYTSESDEDRAVLVMTPYVRYYYRMYTPAFNLPQESEYNSTKTNYNNLVNWLNSNGVNNTKDGKTYAEVLTEADSLQQYLGYIDEFISKGNAYGAEVPGSWQDYTVSVPSAPRVTMVSVDKYDAVASQYKGMTPIYGSDVFGAGYVTGEPGSYRSASSGLANWTGGKIIGAGSAGDDGFLTAGNSGGSMTQSVDVSTSSSSGITWGSSLDVTLVGKVGVVKTGVTTSLEYSGGYIRSSLTGSTIEGTVANMPKNSDGYSFQWQFGSYTATVTDEAGSKKAVTVLGYLVKNAAAPPSLPTDLHVSAITDSSITLKWSEGLRPAMQIEIYRMVNGKPMLLATVDGSVTEYTDTACNPNTAYTYQLRSSGSSTRSVYSQEITETTNPSGDAPKITSIAVEGNAEGEVRAGSTATLAVTVEPVEKGVFPVFQWQKYEEGSGWEDIYNADSIKLTIPNVTPGEDDGFYRCVVNQLVGNDYKKVYSDSIKLTIGRGSSATALSISGGKTAGTADGTVMETKAEIVTVNVPVTAKIGTNSDVYQVVSDGEDSPSYYLIGDDAVYLLTAANSIPTGGATDSSPLDSADACVVALGASAVTEMTSAVADYVTTYTDAESGAVTVTIPAAAMVGEGVSWASTTESAFPDLVPADATDPSRTTATLSDGNANHNVLKVTYILSETSYTNYYLYTAAEGGLTTYTVLGAFAEVTQYKAEESTPVLESVLRAYSPVTRYAKTTQTVETPRSVTGSKLTLTATVQDTASTGKLTPTGTVEFAAVNMSADLGGFRKSAALTGETASAKWTPSAPGLYRITATYSGDNALSGSVSTAVSYYAYLTEADTYLALESADTLVYGSSLTLKPKLVSMSGNAKNETSADNVTYMVNGAAAGSSIDSNVFTPVKAGSYTIRASYTPSGGGAKTLTAEKTVTVTKKPVTVTAKNQTVSVESLTENSSTLLNNWKNGTVIAAAGTLSITGLASGDNMSYVTLFSLRSAGLLDRAGNYSIDVRPNTSANGYAAFSENYSVSYVSGTLTVTVDQYKLTYLAGANGQLSATYKSSGNSNGISFASGKSLPKGSSATFTALPNWGQEVEAWSVNGTVQSGATGTTFTLPNLTADTTVSVSFGPRQYKLTYSAQTAGGGDTGGTVSAAYAGEETAISSNSVIDMTRSVTLTAAPGTGYLVAYWTVNSAERKTASGARYTGETLTLSKADYTGTALTVVAHFATEANYTVTLKAIDENGADSPMAVSFTGEGEYPYGQNAALTASPGNNGQISQWRRYHDSGNLTDAKGAKYTLLQDTATAYTVSSIDTNWDVRVVCKPLSSHMLTFADPANGTLTAEANGVLLTSGIKQPAGLAVTFTVVPNPGYIVKIWSGAAQSADNPNQATIASLNGDTTVSVTLEKMPQVTITTASGGTVEVKNGTQTVRSGDYVPANTQLTVTLKPYTGYEVGTVNGITSLAYTDGTGSTTDDKTGTVTVSDDTAITPVFTALETHTVAFSVAGDLADNGTLTASAARKGMAAYAQNGVSDPITVYEGSTVTFTAVPPEGYQVKEWKVGSAVQADQLGNTLTLPYAELSDRRVTVEFETDSGRIVFTQPAQGTLTVATESGTDFTSGNEANAGAQITFTYTDPGENYEVKEWQVNGTKVENPSEEINEFAYTATGQSAEITAVIQGRLLNVTYAASPREGGTVTATANGQAVDSGEIRYGESLILTAAPSPGYTFDGWFKDGTANAVSTALSYNAGAQTSDASYTAKFTADQYSVSYAVDDGNGTVSVTGGSSGTISVSHGGDLTFTAVPTAGYMVKEWKVGGTVQTGELGNSFTLSNVTSATAVTVSFEAEALFSLPASGDGYTVTVSSRTPAEPGSASQIRKDGTVTFKVSPVTGKQITALTVMGVNCFTGSGSGNVAVTSSSGSYTITVSNVAANVTVSVSVGDPGGGGGGGGGGGAAPDTKHEADIGGKKSEVTVNPDAGSASVELKAEQVESGATIKLPEISGVTNYQVTVPFSALGGTQDGDITISTPSGTLTAPADMVSGTDGEKVQISIGTVNTADLPEAARATVGTRPVISLALSVDGKATAWNNPDAPVTISIPYTPAAGEDPNALVMYYIDGAGLLQVVTNCRYDAGTGAVIFETTHFSYYAVGYNAILFEDVTDRAWYHDAVTFLAAREITSGTTATTFSPDSTLTRGQFITLLLRAYGVEADTNLSDNFSDAGDTYYTGYLAAAKALGISSGVGNNKFAPEQAVTRQEMFTLLYNALKVLNKLSTTDNGKTLADFTDSTEIASWAQEAMSTLVKSGTISGDGGKLAPTGGSTRAQMAQVLYNLLSK